MTRDPSEIIKHPEFAVYTLNNLGYEKALDIAAIFDDTLEKLAQYCPPSREFSIVKTHLETACFFAKKAMAVNPNNQLDTPQAGK
jgi:hypothetical protein